MRSWGKEYQNFGSIPRSRHQFPYLDARLISYFLDGYLASLFNRPTIVNRISCPIGRRIRNGRKELPILLFAMRIITLSRRFMNRRIRHFRLYSHCCSTDSFCIFSPQFFKANCWLKPFHCFLNLPLFVCDENHEIIWVIGEPAHSPF